LEIYLIITLHHFGTMNEITLVRIKSQAYNHPTHALPWRLNLFKMLEVQIFVSYLLDDEKAFQIIKTVIKINKSKPLQANQVGPSDRRHQIKTSTEPSFLS